MPSGFFIRKYTLDEENKGLLQFYVFLWITQLNQEFAYSVAVVALKHDLTVFTGSAACAVCFEFLSDA